MSISETLKESKGSLHTPGPTERVVRYGKTAELVGIYSAGTLNFTAALFFGASGLDFIELTPSASNSAQATIEALRGDYGEPVERERGAPLAETLRWRDDRGNLSIEALNLAGQVIVRYKPLRGAASNRL